MKSRFLLITLLSLGLFSTSCSSEIEKEASEICECAEKAEKENNEDLMHVCRNLYMIFFNKHKNDDAALKRVQDACNIS